MADDMTNVDRPDPLDLQFGAYKRYCIWAILFIALFFRAYNIWGSLWTDEIATYWAATAPTISECIERTITTQGMSPFYFLMERFVLSIFPHNELTLRLPSLISSLISVYLIYCLGKMIFSDEPKALIAALIFSIHQVMVYYGQEARPYAPGIMFVLLSQIYFLKMLRADSKLDTAVYTVSSILAIYCHYTFACIIAVQGAYFAYCFHFKRMPVPLKFIKWIIAESAIIVATLLMLKHFVGMFGGRYGWNWLKTMNPLEACWMYLQMFDPKIIALMGVCLVIFILFQPNEKNCFAGFFKERKDLYFMFAAWLLLPFIFVCSVTYSTGMILFDQRYLVLCLIPFFFIAADVLCIFKSDVLRIAFPGAFLLIYLGLVSIPNCVLTGNFARRVNNDWRGALAHMNSNYRSGDVILLRSGFEKENWIPITDSPVVKEYGKSPFRTFYWKGGKNHPIYNLTYTWDETFYPYYDFVFERASSHRRVWIVGVNPPNTNYPVNNITQLLKKEFYMREVYRMNFSGVHVALLNTENERAE